MSEGEGEDARLSKKLQKKIRRENYFKSRRIPVPLDSRSTSSSSSSSSDDDEAGFQEWLQISKRMALEESWTASGTDSDDEVDKSNAPNNNSNLADRFGGSSGRNETGSSQSKHSESSSSSSSSPASVEIEENQLAPIPSNAAPSEHASNQPGAISSMLIPLTRATIEPKPTTNVTTSSRCLPKPSASALGRTRQETNQPTTSRCASLRSRSRTSSSSSNPPQKFHRCSILKCQKKYTTQDSLRLHMEAHYDMTRKFLCNLCLLRCPSLRGFKNHFTKNHKTIPRMMHHVSRSPCPEMSSSSDPMRVEQEEGEEIIIRKKYSCSISRCLKDLFSSGGFNKHLKAHFDMTRKYRCIVCANRFISMKSLRCHFTTNHKGSTRIPRCQYCKKAFEDHDQLIGHLPCQHARFECSICFTKFKFAKWLRSHHRSYHHRSVFCRLLETGSRNAIKCNVCQKNFRNQSGLREHLKSRFHFEKDVLGSLAIKLETA